MKTYQAWRLGIGDLIMPAPRHRPPLKRPMWIIVLVSLVSLLLIGAYVYPPRRYAACYILSSGGCRTLQWIPPAPVREYTDDEMATRVVIKDILQTPIIQSKNPKIAFMFLTPGSLPFEKLWDKFFRGHDERFSIYIHASREKTVHSSRYFAGRDIRSDKVVWGKISMVDAERRLLANALQDPDNQHFVLLSDSCVPLHDFDYVYNYLIDTNISFIDCFEDPGPHGSGRYSEHMLPEVEKKDFRKGAQWFSMKRQHAMVTLADNLYYTKFKHYCKQKKPHGRMLLQSSLATRLFRLVDKPQFKGEGMMGIRHQRHKYIEGDLEKPGFEGRNCYADEHYLPTLFHMVDPGGIANWSVTHVDWSEGKWHPKAYRAKEVTYELLRNITSIDHSLHVTSDERKSVMQAPCMWNGMKRPCYLFARKFFPETQENLMHLFSNFTAI